MSTGPNNLNDASTSTSLLVRVRLMDEIAWDRFVFVYSPLIRYWCIGWNVTQVDTQDVTQEIFRSVHKSIESFVHETPGSFRGWLKVIAINKVRDFYRSRPPISIDPGCLDAYCESATLSSSEDWEESERLIIRRRAVDLVLSELQPLHREAFVLFVRDERPALDVATELGIKVAQVYLIKSRVLKRLREEFEDLFTHSSNPFGERTEVTGL